MIVTLNGIISEKLLNSITLDVHGVGYGLLIPQETLSKVNIGEQVKLYIYEHIRENMYDLYGFMEADTKKLFELLINVNGVGPKVALSILSVGSVNTVRSAIAGGDIKLIQSASGVGKRVAERILIELKDKVGLLSTFDEQSLLIADAIAQEDEAVQALIALGYALSDAKISLENVDKDLSVEERIKLALRTK